MTRYQVQREETSINLTTLVNWSIGIQFISVWYMVTNKFSIRIHMGKIRMKEYMQCANLLLESYYS